MVQMFREFKCLEILLKSTRNAVHRDREGPSPRQRQDSSNLLLRQALQRGRDAFRVQTVHSTDRSERIKI